MNRSLGKRSTMFTDKPNPVRDSKDERGSGYGKHKSKRGLLRMNTLDYPCIRLWWLCVLSHQLEHCDLWILTWSEQKLLKLLWFWHVCVLEFWLNKISCWRNVMITEGVVKKTKQSVCLNPINLLRMNTLVYRCTRFLEAG